MGSVIPVAKQSPRIENGVLIWYVGDAFTVDWTINLERDGAPVVFEEGDTLEWSFFANMNKVDPIYQFIFPHDAIHNNTVTLFFDQAISAKFPVGSYTYCVKFKSHDGRIFTLNATNKAKVEMCH